LGFDLGPTDLNLLYTLHVFVEAGGVAQAAKRLGRSQPAISARLHQLEIELGVTLFERIGRRLTLTPVGRAVDDEARALLAGARRILDLARSSEKEPVGALRIGCLPTIAVYLLAPTVARFSATHPKVEVRMQLWMSEAHLADLHQGKLDVVVSIGKPPSRGLDVLRLGEVSPVLVARKESSRRRGRVTIAELRKLPLIGYGRTGDPFFDGIWGFLEEHELDGAVRLHVQHIAMIKALVVAGAGVSILPDYVVTEPELSKRPVEGLTLAQPLWLATRKAMRDVPLVQQFCRALKAAR
jgi:DNA-binding transcriptional LysR family regulator